MVIQTLDKNYMVLQRCDTDTELEKYICRDTIEKCYVTLFRTSNRAYIAKIVELLTRKMTNITFGDFKSYFTSGEYFYIVMVHHRGESLAAKLDQEAVTLAERIEIGSQILKKIILLDMPPYFLCDSLKPEQIMVSQAMQIAFNYELKDLADYETYSFYHALNQLAELTEWLFRTELRKKMIPQLTKFYQELDRDIFHSYLDIYKRYQEICEPLKTMPPEQTKSPNTWIYSSWERLKRLGKPLTYLVAAGVMVAAVVYLGYTIRLTKTVGSSQLVFPYIGTLELEK